MHPKHAERFLQSLAANSPQLAAECIPMLEPALASTASFIAHCAWLHADGSFDAERVSITAEELRLEANLGATCDALGFLRAARLLAAIAEEEVAVTPRILRAALVLCSSASVRAVLSTPECMSDFDALESHYIDHALTPEELGNLRLAALLPAPLVEIPDDWSLAGVEPTMPFVGIPTTGAMRDVGPGWLVAQFIGRAYGVPNMPMEHIGAPSRFDKRTFRDVVDTHASEGWNSVLCESLACTPWGAKVSRLQHEPLESLLERVVSDQFEPVEMLPAPAEPTSPVSSPPAVDVPALFAALRAALGRRVGPFNAGILDRLAMSGVLHVLGHGLNRLLLAGPTGSGKTHLINALAEAIAEVADVVVPVVTIDASTIQETGFSLGVQANEIARLLIQRAGGSMEHAARWGVLLLDEADKVMVPADSYANSRTKREGQQYALLPIVGGGVLTLEGATGDLRFDRILVCAAGAFAHTDWAGSGRPISTADLVNAGWLGELAERFGDRINLPSHTMESLLHVLVSGAGSAAATMGPLAAACGWSLDIVRETSRLVAIATLRGDRGLGPRSANELLVQAARSVVTRALNEGRPRGEVLRVTPDDVELPPRRAAQQEDKRPDGDSFLASN